MLALVAPLTAHQPADNVTTERVHLFYHYHKTTPIEYHQLVARHDDHLSAIHAAAILALKCKRPFVRCAARRPNPPPSTINISALAFARAALRSRTSSSKHHNNMQPNGKSIGGIGISTTGISTTARKPTNDNTDTSSQRAATRQFRHKQQTKTQTTLLPAPLGVYRALWLLFHALFRWYASARHTWQQAVHALAQRFEATNDWAVIDSGTRQLDCSTAAADDCNNATTKRECELIAKCRADLAKVPVHVAVILNERCEEAGMDDGETVAAQEAASMARLLRWVSYTGIEHISFYDYRGMYTHLFPVCVTEHLYLRTVSHFNRVQRVTRVTVHIFPYQWWFSRSNQRVATGAVSRDLCLSSA